MKEKKESVKSTKTSEEVLDEPYITPWSKRVKCPSCEKSFFRLTNAGVCLQCFAKEVASMAQDFD